MPSMNASTTTPARRRGGALLLGACLLLAGCAGVAHGPTYTEAELKARCESRGGRWYPTDIGEPFCQYR